MGIVLVKLLAALLVLQQTGCGGGGGEGEEIKPTPVPYSGPYLGVDYLSLPSSNFPCNRALDVYQNISKPAIGTLWSTFGNDYSCLVEFWDRTKDRANTLTRIHISNEWCRKHRLCGEGEIMPGVSVVDMDWLLETRDANTLHLWNLRIQEIDNFIKANAPANTRVVLSVGLEPSMSKKAREVLRQLVKGYGYDTANDGSLDSFTFVELHHTYGFRKPCIASLDGVDFAEPTAMPWCERAADYCDAVLLWSAASQGYPFNGWVFPRDRNIFLSELDVSAMNNILLELQGENK